MKAEKYFLHAESHLETFSFISEGPKGNVLKLIEFQPTDNPNVFNLAFGDQDPVTGGINDLVVTNNGDTDKVLETVVEALYRFAISHPNTYVYATGSTPARTRLYRIGITRFYQQIQQDFRLYGQKGDALEPFRLGEEYEEFLAQRKFE